MPRTYKPKPGAKSYKKYDNLIIQEALQELKQSSSIKTPSIRSVAEKYGIPFSVLQRHKSRTMKTQGGQTALTPEAEEYIIANLNICAEWGYPLDKTDLRHIVKMYLDTSKIHIKRFKNNLPWSDFTESFLKRHSDKLSTRISQNIKRLRAELSPETMRTYFFELEKSLVGVPQSNIVNYDETNLTDDPGRQKVIVRRGCKYPEMVRNHTKGSTSLMIAANAEGELLPPYVVYKSTHLYDSWTRNGPTGTRFNRSSSGWFDGQFFCDWVETILFPYFNKKTGKKILIGDNLSSHLSLDLIKTCKEKNIHFVFLPANSTHLTQPLDVAFFRPMKQAWRQILQKWKQNDGRCMSSIPKGCFPQLLKLLFDNLIPNAEKNIRAGFRKTGICPLNCEEVISRLPSEMNRADKDAVDESFMTLLKEMRYGTINVTEPKKKRKLDVIPGRSVDPEELYKNNEQKQVNYDKNDGGKTLKNKGIGKKTKPKQTNNTTKLIPVSLDTRISIDRNKTINPSASNSLDIESLPMIFEEDLFFSQEETCKDVSLESTTQIYKAGPINENENVKKCKIKIISDEMISHSYVERKEVPSSGGQNIERKRANISSIVDVVPPKKRRNSVKSKNYYVDADEILQILQD